MVALKRILGCVLPAALVALAAPAGEWPSRPITLLCPMPPGGSIDSLARVVAAPALENALKVKVIVKNVSGAAGTTGTAEVADAKADGNIFLITPLGPVIIQPALRQLPYDRTDFIPVAFVADNPYYLITPRNVPYKTFQEFIDYVKANPDKLSYGSVGPGSLPHMNMAALCAEYGLKMTHIPDRGGAEVQKSMATGTVQAVCDSGIFITRFDNQGLVVFDDGRQPDFESIPSAKELGVPLRFSVWMAVWAPKGTPDAIIQRVNEILVKTNDDPKAQQALKSFGSIGRKMSPAELRDFVVVEAAKFEKLVDDLGLKAR